MYLDPEASAIEIFKGMNKSTREVYGSHEFLLEHNAYKDLPQFLKHHCLNEDPSQYSILDINCSFGAQGVDFTNAGFELYVGIDPDIDKFICEDNPKAKFYHEHFRVFINRRMVQIGIDPQRTFVLMMRLNPVDIRMTREDFQAYVCIRRMFPHIIQM